MKTVFHAFGFAAIGAAAALAVQSATRLYVNGSLASTDVIERGGKAYVPVRDVAAALKMSVTKSSRGWEMGAAGGATAIAGVQGRIGDELWDGRVRFKVTEIVRGKSYERRFGAKYTMTAGEGRELVAVICRVKNGVQKTMTVDPYAGKNTSLTDMEEHSYRVFTGLYTDVSAWPLELVPGAAGDFALIFEVPQGTALKDLIYTHWDTAVGAKPTDFRVSVLEP